MTSISVRKDDLQAKTTDSSETRSAALGGYHVEFGSISAGFAMGPELFEGLPDNACQCPHWGVLLKGEFRVPFADGRIETVRAGEAYYLPPGHRFEVTQDCEYIEFSPSDELQATFKVVARNSS